MSTDRSTPSGARTPDAPLVGVFRGVGDDITDGDDAFCAILGRTRASFVDSRRTLEPLSPPEWSEVDRLALDEARRTGGFTAPYRKEFVRGDGTLVPVLVVIAIVDADQDRWIGYVVDLSARGFHRPLHVPDRLTEPQPQDFYAGLISELLRERDRHLAMLDGSPVLIWAVDRDVRLVAANERFHAETEIDLGRRFPLGTQLLDATAEDRVAEGWPKWYAAALDGGTVDVVAPGPIDNFDRVTLGPLSDPDGHVIGAIATAQDITEAQRAEQARQRTATLMRIAARLGGVSGWRLDTHTGQVELSQELVETLGLRASGPFPLEETLRWYPSVHRGLVATAIERCATEGTPFELELHLDPDDFDPRRAPLDLGVRWLRVVGEPVERDGHVVEVAGALVDITRSKELELRHRELADVVRHSNESIIVRDFDGIVTAWNDAASRLYGWTEAEAIGSHIADLVDGGPRDAFHSMTEQLLRDGSWDGRFENLDRAGRSITVDLHVDLIRDEHGEPVRIFSIASDATDRIELERRVADAQRLESVGQLTGGVAHDFNNLLTIVIGSLDRLAESDDDEHAELARMALEAAERGARLTAQLLAFARRQTLQPRAVDVGTAIEDVAALLRRSLPEPIELEVDVATSVGRAWVDPQQLDSAIMNLAINARDAMPDGGRLRISARAERGGTAIVIEVSDSGHGLSAEARSRAFEPFFTTKGPATNSGLGLSMVHGFVHQSGGSVELDDAPGGGTIVRIVLPRTERSEEPSSEVIGSEHTGPTQVATARGDERVLVVEDERLVSRHAASVLRTLGYRVDTAPDGPSALAHLETNGPVDVLFTDIVMPAGMDGHELARQVVDRWPGTRVLYTTGHVADAAAAHRAVAPLAPVLAKPYRRASLAAALRDVLDAPAPS